MGRAIADLLVGSDWNAVLVSRHSSDVTDERTPHFVADVSSEQSVRAAVRSILNGGSIDALVYSVGLKPDVGTPLSDYDSADWRKTFAAYVDGLFYVYKAILPSMERGGHILAISSAITRLSSDSLPPFNAGHYAAAKSALDEFCKWARREAHERGLLMSRVAPGSVRSPTSDALRVPVKNTLSPESVALRVVEAIVKHQEIDEQMLANSSAEVT